MLTNLSLKKIGQGEQRVIIYENCIKKYQNLHLLEGYVKISECVLPKLFTNHLLFQTNITHSKFKLCAPLNEGELTIMKKVNKQCLLDTPRTVRVSEKNWQVIVQTSRP